MAKFFGAVGYGLPTEVAPGVWDDVITERNYYGDVIRNARTLDSTDVINSDLSVSNTISIVADAYANQHFFAIRYVEWAGARWNVDNVEVNGPRLLLRLGGVYHGLTPTAPVTP